VCSLSWPRTLDPPAGIAGVNHHAQLISLLIDTASFVPFGRRYTFRGIIVGASASASQESP
jgi:hypothetical protein